MPTLRAFTKEPISIPTNQFSDRVLKFGRTAGALVAFIFGSIVLVGWVVDSRALKGAGFWGDITVKTNTGLMMLSSGLALLIYNFGREKRNSIFAVRLISSFIVVISVITIAEHIFGFDFGIDQAFFSEASGELATSSPNRMGPPASVCFTLYGAALLLLLSKRSAAADIATALSALVGLIALIPSLGYLLGANSLYTVAGVTGIALPTALALLAVSFGLILSADDSRYI